MWPAKLRIPHIAVAQQIHQKVEAERNQRQFPQARADGKTKISALRQCLQLPADHIDRQWQRGRDSRRCSKRLEGAAYVVRAHLSRLFPLVRDHLRQPRTQQNDQQQEAGPTKPAHPLPDHVASQPRDHLDPTCGVGQPGHRMAEFTQDHGRHDRGTANPQQVLADQLPVPFRA